MYRPTTHFCNALHEFVRAEGADGAKLVQD